METMCWFGPASWDAPVNEDTPRTGIPVGRPCAYCRVKIEDHDRGLLIPNLGGGSSAWHLDCLRVSIGMPPSTDRSAQVFDLAVVASARRPRPLTRAKALELREQYTVAEIAEQYDLEPAQVDLVLRAAR